MSHLTNIPGTTWNTVQSDYAYEQSWTTWMMGVGQLGPDGTSTLRMNPGAGLVAQPPAPAGWPWSILGNHLGGLVQQPNNGQNEGPVTIYVGMLSRLLAQPAPTPKTIVGTGTPGTTIILDTQGPDPIIEEV